MIPLIEGLVAVLILIGAAFLFIGSLGLAKLPDTMRRLHAPTKSSTVGIGALLLASMLFFVALRGASGVHELLITLFVFLTAPVTANMIAKVHLFRAGASVPPATGGSTWATLDGSGAPSQEIPPDSRP